MRYVLSYERVEEKYRVSCGGGIEEFSQFNRVWAWLGNTLEPGDLLEWIR